MHWSRLSGPNFDRQLELDVLLVEDPAVYPRERRRMVGRALRLPWWNVRTWLSRPLVATHKAERGGWTPAKFKGDHKLKANLVHASALLIDVDEGGDVDRIADLLVGHLAVVHSTFSSTPEKPRCRIVLPLVEPVDAATYETAWKAAAAHLGAHGVTPDMGTKDAGRLGYMPCVRAGAGYRFRSVDGDPLDARAAVAAQPAEPPRVHVPSPASEHSGRHTATEHSGRYIAAALRKAAHAVASASAGTRHDLLNREAYGLARLDLTEGEIREALLPAFVQAAGEGRIEEGERAIRDAVKARGGT